MRKRTTNRVRHFLLMNSHENWDLRVDDSVYKATRKFPRRDARAIHDCIDTLSSDPYGGDIRKLAGAANAWRRRIRAYRIFFEIVSADRSILVYHVERRTSKTY